MPILKKAKTQNHIEAHAATTEAVAVKTETGEVVETKEVGLIAEIKEILTNALADEVILKRDHVLAGKTVSKVDLEEILVTD
jgi:hypothetical protein